MARGNTWANSDSLNVGFGTHTPTVVSAVAKNDGGGVKVAHATFDWKQVNAAETIQVNIPAGSRIVDVEVIIGDDAWTSTGTNTAEVGDGTDANGFHTTTVLTVAAMTANKKIPGDGVLLFGATDAGAREFTIYASAGVVLFASAQTDWLGGQATLKVLYI
jgi:hypothetical protein